MKVTSRQIRCHSEDVTSDLPKKGIHFSHDTLPPEELPTPVPLTPEEERWLDMVHPPLRVLIREQLRVTNQILDERRLYSDDPEEPRYVARLEHTGRTEQEHTNIYSKKTRKVPYSRTLHGVKTKKEGRWDARAWHITIVDEATGRWAPDGHAVWGCAVAAAYIVGGVAVKCGAFFKTAPGGDWAHHEQRGADELLRKGQL